MRSVLLRVALGTVGGLLLLAVLCFLCGVCMGVVDAIGRSKDVDLVRYGVSGILFGMLVTGVPVAIASAVASLIHARGLTTRCNGLAMKPGGVDNPQAASH
jgi:hypothetical protein